MKENHNPTFNPQVSALLRAARVTPTLPPRFEQSVWRRIEAAEASASPGAWLDALARLILRPRFAVAATAVLLLAGIFAGTREGRQLARHDAQMNYLASVVPHALR